MPLLLEYCAEISHLNSTEISRSYHEKQESSGLLRILKPDDSSGTCRPEGKDGGRVIGRKGGKKGKDKRKKERTNIGTQRGTTTRERNEKGRKNEGTR